MKKINGHWKEGYVLDYHTISSAFIGYDEFGHKVFDSKRSAAGDILFRLKYRGIREAMFELRPLLIELFEKWPPHISMVVPVPPNNPGRAVKPVILIADFIAKLKNVTVKNDVIVRKQRIKELKNIYEYNERLDNLRKAYDVIEKSVENERILLVDDLYRSGATMNYLADLLVNKGGASEVYAFAVTRTRSNR